MYSQISKFPSFKVVKFKISEIPTFKLHTSTIQEQFKVSKAQHIQISKLQNIKVSRFAYFKIANSKNSENRITTFQKCWRTQVPTTSTLNMPMFAKTHVWK